MLIYQISECSEEKTQCLIWQIEATELDVP